MKLREQSHPLNTITDRYGEKGVQNRKLGSPSHVHAAMSARLAGHLVYTAAGLACSCRKVVLKAASASLCTFSLQKSLPPPVDRMNSQLHIGCLPVIPEHEICKKPTLGWATVHSYFFGHSIIHSLISVPYSFMEFL